VKAPLRVVPEWVAAAPLQLVHIIVVHCGCWGRGRQARLVAPPGAPRLRGARLIGWLHGPAAAAHPDQKKNPPLFLDFYKVFGSWSNFQKVFRTVMDIVLRETTYGGGGGGGGGFIRIQ
jgi:hypothetical protein